MSNLVILVYSHPEAYPPTLNAITTLSKYFNKIFLLGVNNLPDLTWQYPNNVEVILNGDYVHANKIHEKSLLWKVSNLVRYILQLQKILTDKEVHLVISYDPISLFAYEIVSKFLPKKDKPLLWYHNHDVLELSKTKKYTIAWAAALAEKRIFKEIDFFSLPAQDRKPYFPLERLKGQYFFIPNVPAKSLYKNFISPRHYKIRL